MTIEFALKSEISITPLEFEKILPEICDAEISYVPERWTPDNSLCGTCVPVALVANRVFGGKLLRADLKPFPKFKYMRWHWANFLPGGIIRDFSRIQFGDDYPEGMEFVEKPAETITRHSNVVTRTNILYERLLSEVKNV